MNDGIKTIATRRFNKKPGTKNDTHDLVDLILLADWAVGQLVTPSRSQIDLADVIESLEFAMQGRASDEAARGAIHGSVNVLKAMYGAVEGFPNLAAMREQMEELAAENRLLKQQMQALQDSGNFRKLVRNKRLADQAAQTHGCHDCGEERPARVVAGKLTCPECGSENIVCID